MNTYAPPTLHLPYTYTTSAWAPAANKISVQKHLNAVQRGFAQKICKAYCTVSLNAALQLARVLPLDLRIHEAALLYEARRGKPQAVIGDRELEGKVCFLEADHPAVRPKIEFECLEDVEPETIRKHNIQGVHIYTDGSKIQGKVGAALSCWDNGSEIKHKKFKLEPFCTVFQAELFALYRATAETLASGWKDINIFSDSRSALELVQSDESFHPLVVLIQTAIVSIANQGKTIRLFWIRAHVGVRVVGNERADELAKNAALYKKTAPDYDKCPTSFIKRQIRTDTLLEWSKRYTNGSTAAVTKMFLPDALQAYQLLKKIGINPMFVQLLTGYGGFSAYLNRFKLKNSCSCVCDPEKEETVEHLLIECPKYDLIRISLEIEMDKKISKDSISEILESKLVRDKFISYCLKIAKEVIHRSKT